MTFQFYVGKKFPEVGDIVWTQIKKISDDNSYLNIELLEYPINGIIQTKNLSRRMKSRKGRWRSYIPKVPVPTTVVDVDKHRNSVIVSKRHLTDDDISTYTKYFISNNRLVKIIKRMAVDFEIDFSLLWQQIIFPLQKLLDENINIPDSSLLNILQNKYNEYLKNNKETDYILDILSPEYKKYLNNKIDKTCNIKKTILYSDFLMVVKPPENINTIKILYQNIIKNHKKLSFIMTHNNIYKLTIQENDISILTNIIYFIKKFVENKNIYFELKTPPKII